MHKYNQIGWSATLRDNIKSTQYLHTHNPNYISKPPLELYKSESKQYYNPKQNIDRDLAWKSSRKKVNLNKSQEHVFRSTSKRVDDYHKRNNSGNIISQFVKNPQAFQPVSIRNNPHPAAEKRKQIRLGKSKDDLLSKSSVTINSKPNYMDSKLMKQTIQYQNAPTELRTSYMPRRLRNK